MAMKAEQLGPDTNTPWLRQMRVLDTKAWAIFMSQYEPNLRAYARQARVKPSDVDEIISRLKARLCQEFSRKVGQDYLPFRSYLADCMRQEIRRFRYETSRFLGRKVWYLVQDWWRLWRFEALPKELEAFIALTTEDLSPKAEYIRELYKHVKQRVDSRTFETYYRVAIKGESYKDLALETGQQQVALRMSVMRVRRLIDQFNLTNLGQDLIQSIQGKPLHLDPKAQPLADQVSQA